MDFLPSFLPVVVLSLVQGLTEFLPISSSAHLVLVPIVFGWPDQGIAFSIAVHGGTLSALLLYFRRDFINMSYAFVAHLGGGTLSCEGRLAWLLILATVPISLVGLALLFFDIKLLPSALLIAVANIGFALLLLLADWRCGAAHRDTDHWGFANLRVRDALWIGLAQTLAIIPGASRSGVTITAALLLGLDRVTAVRFSMLLAMPVIVLATISATIKLIHAGDFVALAKAGIGALLAALIAYATIHLFLQLLERIGLWPFIVYRIALGALILALLAS